MQKLGKSPFFSPWCLITKEEIDWIQWLWYSEMCSFCLTWSHDIREFDTCLGNYIFFFLALNNILTWSEFCGWGKENSLSSDCLMYWSSGTARNLVFVISSPTFFAVNNAWSLFTWSSYLVWIHKDEQPMSPRCSTSNVNELYSS